MPESIIEPKGEGDTQERPSSVDLPSTVSEKTAAIPGVDGIVELFIDDADPRGEAFADFLSSFPDTANNLGDNSAAMYVVNNEEEFSARRTNATPDNFDQAYLTTDAPVRQLVAYIETFLSDYTQGQDNLEVFMSIPEAAEQLGDSKQAMRVINEGDDRPDLQDYRV